MLIYLDANIVQYCADYGDFLYRREGARRPPNRKLKMELIALAEIIEMALRAEEQDFDHRWDVAAPGHLLDELHGGCPTPEQLDTYDSLRDAWRDLGNKEYGSPDAEAVNAVENTLRKLNLRDPPDRRHLAEAVAIGARWFLTLDEDILDKTRDVPSEAGIIKGVIVMRPSELWENTAFDPVFGLRVLENGLTTRYLPPRTGKELRPLLRSPFCVPGAR